MGYEPNLKALNSRHGTEGAEHQEEGVRPGGPPTSYGPLRGAELTAPAVNPFWSERAKDRDLPVKEGGDNGALCDEGGPLCAGGAGGGL